MKKGTCGPTYSYGSRSSDRQQEWDSRKGSPDWYADGNLRDRYVANRQLEARVVNNNSNSNRHRSGYANRGFENQ
ncbi:hypothetical protein TNCT_687801 [Trichonephila clavata]|uniref:Uncharacterized protein n=1 Tax=Trichonephila clavata TaxID=2740835 RepID=A0A8X6G1F2_TRICU|nr:hypothetical protein TNCT_687801 [Trichonephila clavata]